MNPKPVTWQEMWLAAHDEGNRARLHVEFNQERASKQRAAGNEMAAGLHVQQVAHTLRSAAIFDKIALVIDLIISDESVRKRLRELAKAKWDAERAEQVLAHAMEVEE